MRSLFLLCLLALCFPVFGQDLKQGQSGAPTVINVSDESVPDFFPSLINLSQHPVPATSDFGNRKQELNQLRDVFEKQHPRTVERKTRSSVPSPVLIKNYQGNSASSVPNDNDIAVSNNGTTISVVNSNLAVYNDTGKLIKNKALSTIFSSVGNFSWISDPRVLYDPNADRFILVCFYGSLSTESTILVAFTQNNDPTGNWNCYTLNGASFNDSTWSDYPILAITGEDLFITFNQVKDNVSWTIGFRQSVIWQITKQDGYDGNPLKYNLWSNIQHGGTNLRNICPAKYQTTYMPNRMFFLTLRNVASSNDSIFLTEITDSRASGHAQLKTRVLRSPVPYGFPPNVRQKKGSGSQQYLMTNDARVLAAVCENDYIHFGSNTLNPEFMNASVMLGTIKYAGTSNPQVQTTILNSANSEYGYPSMAYMGDDHKMIYTFSHCYIDSFAGTSMVYQNESGQFSDIIAVRNGTTVVDVIADSNERWGDYSNIQMMYNNPKKAYLSGSYSGGTRAYTCIGIVTNADSANTSNYSTEIYPNPTNTNHFIVHFELEEEQLLNFSLFDMQGRKVATLLNTRAKQGSNDFTFETSPLASGNYILKIVGDKKEIASAKVTIK